MKELPWADTLSLPKMGVGTLSSVSSFSQIEYSGNEVGHSGNEVGHSGNEVEIE